MQVSPGCGDQFSRTCGGNQRASHVDMQERANDRRPHSSQRLQIDSLFHLRKAIEFCAFAARMARHPEMSRTWLLAASSDEAWDKFREKFRKLFPDDDPKLKHLELFYEEASQAMHGSVRAVAHYLSGRRKAGPIPNITAFDIGSQPALVSYFINLIDCHLTILTVFERILKPYAPSIAAWSQQLYAAKEFFTAKHGQWSPFVAQLG